MPVIECEQRSSEWLHARCGRITASRVADVLARLKNGGESAVRTNYRIELVGERLTGMATEGYVNADMQRGIDLEPMARAAYEVTRNVMVDQVGFIVHPGIDMAGASPDGLVGTDGMLEIKVPRISTHIKWMLAGGVPEEHKPQMLLQLACANRQWSDFCSYCPELPERLQLFIVRFPRDDKRIAELEDEVIKFNAEVDELMKRLQ